MDMIDPLAREKSPEEQAAIEEDLGILKREEEDTAPTIETSDGPFQVRSLGACWVWVSGWARIPVSGFTHRVRCVRGFCHGDPRGCLAC